MKCIDLFAGCGGFTEAAKLAGVRVRWAANHWPAAVETHAANHPDIEHSCQDLHQAAWDRVPSMDLLLASPACQGHSKARGAERPHHDLTRSTAWAVVSCCEYHRPEVAIVENVREFAAWRLYRAWRQAMQDLGYAVAENEIDAADAGVPQHRVRMFIVCTLSRAALWIKRPRVQHVPANEIIDFDAGNWSKVMRPGRASATIERWRDGRRRLGDRFVFSFYGNTRRARSIDLPIGTITTRDRWAVVDGDWMRMLTVAECQRAMGFREDYILPANRRLAVHLLGNAVPPGLAAHVINEVRRAA